MKKINLNIAGFMNSRWVELAKKKGSEDKVRKEFHDWVKGAKDTKLVKRAQQLWDYFNSGKVSGMEKVLIVAALLYLISPIDLVPDFIPVVGWLDDIGVAGLVMDYVLKKMDGKGEGEGKGKGGKKHKTTVERVIKAVRKSMKQ